MATKPKRPRDVNQIAKLIVDLASGEARDKDENEGKNTSAVLRGRLGGIKGGVARKETLTGEQRTAIAKKAAKARWKRS